MGQEWPKELPPFEKMEEIFFKGGFDPDGDMYYDRKSGKKILGGYFSWYSGGVY